MPKMKTHKGIAKRVKITASGKVMVRKSGKGHLMAGKRGKKVRQLRGWKELTGTNARVIKKLLAKGKGV